MIETSKSEERGLLAYWLFGAGLAELVAVWGLAMPVLINQNSDIYNYLGVAMGFVSLPIATLLFIRAWKNFKKTKFYKNHFRGVKSD